MTLDWTLQEPGRKRLRRELSRLWGRAKARPIVTLLLAAAMSAAVVYLYARRPTLYSAQVVLSMRESGLDPTASPRAKLELRSYIADAVFNRQNLWQIIEKHDLFPGLRERDPSFAIDKLWDTLDVDVYRNEFAEVRQERLRSARIAVRYASLDPKLAESVADDLAKYVVDFEAKKRRAAATLALDHMNRVLDNAQRTIVDRTRELSRKRTLFELGFTDDQALLGIEISGLERALKSAEDRIELVEKAMASLQFKASLESRQLAMEFSIVDRQRPIPVPRSLALLISLAVGMFLLCLAPAGLAVGAFDSRIYNREDIERLGVPVLGHVPAFPGTRVGSMARRRAKSG